MPSRGGSKGKVKAESGGEATGNYVALSAATLSACTYGYVAGCYVEKEVRRGKRESLTRMVACTLPILYYVYVQDATHRMLPSQIPIRINMNLMRKERVFKYGLGRGSNIFDVMKKLLVLSITNIRELTDQSINPNPTLICFLSIVKITNGSKN